VPPIPRLGQGFSGGRAALSPGLGLPGGTGSLSPRLSLPGGPLTARQPDTPTPSFTPAATPSFTPAPQESVGVPEEDLAQKAARLAHANQILREVRDGMKEPADAQHELDVILRDDTERQDLTKAILKRQALKGGDPRTELQALRFSPLGKSPGAQTQSGPGAGLGIGSNLFRDINQTVAGFPAGVGLAAKAVGQDVYGSFRHPMRRGFQHTQEEIIEPVAQAYAHQYGPLLPGGTPIQEFGHRFAEHPLGPLLDVAAVASAGVGAAERTAGAIGAVRAGRFTTVATPADAEAARNAALAAQKSLIDPKSPHPVTGAPMSNYKRPSPEELAAEPWKGHISGFYNVKNGRSVVGHPGSAHADVLQQMEEKAFEQGGEAGWQRARADLKNMEDAKAGWRPYTAIIDPETGKVGAVNFWESMHAKPVSQVRAEAGLGTPTRHGGGPGIKLDPNQYMLPVERGIVGSIMEKHADLTTPENLAENLTHLNDEGASHMVQVATNEDPLAKWGVNQLEEVPVLRSLIAKHGGEASHFAFGEEVADAAGLPPGAKAHKTTEVNFPDKLAADAFEKDLAKLPEFQMFQRQLSHPETEGAVPSTMGELMGWLESWHKNDLMGQGKWAGAVLKDLRELTGGGKTLTPVPKPAPTVATRKTVVDPEDIAANAQFGRIPGFYDKKSGTLYLGKPAGSHSDVDLPRGIAPEDLLEINVNMTDEGKIGSVLVEKNVFDQSSDSYDFADADFEDRIKVEHAVRDQLGDLDPKHPSVTLFRGDKTPIERGNFKLEKSKTEEQLLTQGLYFTPSQHLARRFGEHVTEIEVPKKHLEKILDLSHPATPEIKQAFLNAVERARRDTEYHPDDYLSDETLPSLIEDDKNYWATIEAGVRSKESLDVGDLLHQEGKGGAVWKVPEGLYNPVFQVALREELQKLGYKGLSQQLDPKNPIGKEIAFWDEDIVNKPGVHHPPPGTGPTPRTPTPAPAAPQVARTAHEELLGIKAGEPHVVGENVEMARIPALFNFKTGDFRVGKQGQHHDQIADKDLPIAEESLDPNTAQVNIMLGSDGRIIGVNGNRLVEANGEMDWGDLTPDELNRVEETLAQYYGTGKSQAARTDELGQPIYGENNVAGPGEHLPKPRIEDLAGKPWAGKVVISTDKSGRQAHFGLDEHDELWQEMQDRGILDDENSFNGEPQIAATGMFDPRTGELGSVNIGGIDAERAGLTPAEVKALEAKLLEKGHRVFNPKPDTGEVDEFGVPLSEWYAPHFTNNQTTLDEDFIVISAAIDKQTGDVLTSERAHTEMTDDLSVKYGVEDAWQSGRFDQYTVIVDREGKVMSVNGKNEFMQDEDRPPPEGYEEKIRNQVEAKFARGKELNEGPTTTPTPAPAGKVGPNPFEEPMVSWKESSVSALHRKRTQNLIENQLWSPEQGISSRVPMKVTEAGTNKAIVDLWDHLDEMPNFDVDHFESLLNRLGEHAHPEFNYEGWGTKDVKDPHAFAQQLGGIAEYARSVAEGPEQLQAIEGLIDEVYKSIKTPVPVETLKAAAGPARTLNDDLLDALEPKYGGDIQGGHPRADPMGDIGRQDPRELFRPYEKQINPKRARLPRPVTTRVGENHTVTLGPKGYEVRWKGRVVSTGYLDNDTAIKAAQLDALGPTNRGKNLGFGRPKPKTETDRPMTPRELAFKGATKRGARGGLVDLYERNIQEKHTRELGVAMKEIADVLDDENLQLKRKTFKEVLGQVKADLKSTRARGKAEPWRLHTEHPSFISPRTTGRVLATGTATLREVSDLIRAGAIYLRPAYLPNNWVGNSFMNLVQQGALAPVNFGKSFALDKHLGPRYVAALDHAMGQNPATVLTAGRGRGYIASVTDPVARTMGAIADQPFRRSAFLHEARKNGHSKLSQVRDLFDGAAKGKKADLEEIADIARRAQEEIVKFGHMNDMERQVLRNLFFVYSWVRGAARYAARFPMQHAIQSAVLGHVSRDVGQPYLDRELGGIPSYLSGSVPVGRTAKGDPILINPVALNPLGTGLDLLRAVAGTAQVIRNPRNFDKYVKSDVIDLLNPLGKSYLEAREGGQPIGQELLRTIAPVRLAHDLRHPGSGSVYPTSRAEALGRYSIGSLYPRVANQDAITRGLIRENQNNPVALIPHEVEQFEKLTGQHVPPILVRAYRADLIEVQQQKNFQLRYASSKGQRGFANLPATNRAKAALDYLEQYNKVPRAELNDYRKLLDEQRSEAATNELANSLWSLTGAGQVKSQWDDIMSSVAGLDDERIRERK
jgi:hypothetical protein